MSSTMTVTHTESRASTVNVLNGPVVLIHAPSDESLRHRTLAKSDSVTSKASVDLYCTGDDVSKAESIIGFGNRAPVSFPQAEREVSAVRDGKGETVDGHSHQPIPRSPDERNDSGHDFDLSECKTIGSASPKPNDNTSAPDSLEEKLKRLGVSPRLSQFVDMINGEHFGDRAASRIIPMTRDYGGKWQVSTFCVSCNQYTMLRLDVPISDFNLLTGTRKDRLRSRTLLKPGTARLTPCTLGGESAHDRPGDEDKLAAADQWNSKVSGWNDSGRQPKIVVEVTSNLGLKLKRLIPSAPRVFGKRIVLTG